MKFDTELSDSNTVETKHVFRAPIDGYYEIAFEVATFVPTGKFIKVPNYRHKWYTFWEPKTVFVEEMNKVYSWDGREIRYLKEGEVVTEPGFKIE